MQSLTQQESGRLPATVVLRAYIYSCAFCKAKLCTAASQACDAAVGGRPFMVQIACVYKLCSFSSTHDAGKFLLVTKPRCASLPKLHQRYTKLAVSAATESDPPAGVTRSFARQKSPIDTI